MKPTPEVQRTIASIPGWVSDSECAVLYDLASQAGIYPIVELGSCMGKSTVALALGAVGSRVYAVDSQLVHADGAGVQFDGPKNKAAFLATIVRLGLGEVVYVVNLTSRQTALGWQEPIGLLFIDGDHAKAQQDLELWHPYIVDGGLLAIHDYETWQGPRDAYRQAVNWGYAAVTATEGLGVLRKVGGPHIVKGEGDNESRTNRCRTMGPEHSKELA